MPKFLIGEESVIFAVDRQGLVNPIIGFWHGRVPISRDPSGTARVLRHDRTPFVRGSALTETPDVTSPELVQPMTLERFLSDVRQVMRAGSIK
jgi:hypothetical protein